MSQVRDWATPCLVFVFKFLMYIYFLGYVKEF
jgi:hypothetical protein